jgi:hypothetical protein
MSTVQLQEPKIAIRWIYGYPDPPILHGRMLTSLRNLATHRMTGERFSGKSALGEVLQYKYVMNGATGYDFYSAKSNEALAVLDCQQLKDHVILVHSDNVKLKCNYRTIPISQIDPTRDKEGDLYVTVTSFYENKEAKYMALLNFTEKLEERAESGYNHIDCFFIREAQEYINSKTLTGQSRTQKEASEAFIEFHNGAYHSGVSVIVDSQRAVEVAKNIRELNTFTYYKSYGSMEIPDSIHWIASQYYANYDLDDLRSLSQSQFLIITNRNCVGVGTFELPYWHFDRGTPMMEKHNIIVSDLTGNEITAKTRTTNNLNIRTQGRGGRKRITSANMRENIDRMVNEGKEVTEIYEALYSGGFRGSMMTVRREVYAAVAKKASQGRA